LQKLRNASISLVMSVRLHGTNMAPAAGILLKFDVLRVFRKSAQHIEVALKSDKNNGYITCRPMYVYDYILFNSTHNEKRLIKL
jgi:hypothetical protein